MRHNKKLNHLGRTNTHRNAMFSNMACSLIKHKRIFTTVAKAKALRSSLSLLLLSLKRIQLTQVVWYSAICKTNML